MGLAVEDEARVGNYSLDCYLPEAHAGVECDGPTHRGRRAREYDQRRDAWIMQCAGIPVLRVTSDQLRNAQVRLGVTHQLEDFVAIWAPTRVERAMRASVLVG